MKLNKYQRAWIKKLKSGTTKKAIGALAKNGGSKCCLGVGIATMRPLSWKVCEAQEVYTLQHKRFPYEYRNLSINGEYGELDINKIKPKWRKIIEDSILKNEDDLSYLYSLAGLNDLTSMTHAQIGEFIDQNREAVFV